MYKLTSSSLRYRQGLKKTKAIVDDGTRNVLYEKALIHLSELRSSFRKFLLSSNSWYQDFLRQVS
jgi:hypothetical protein